MVGILPTSQSNSFPPPPSSSSSPPLKKSLLSSPFSSPLTSSSRLPVDPNNDTTNSSRMSPFKNFLRLLIPRRPLLSLPLLVLFFLSAIIFLPPRFSIKLQRFFLPSSLSSPQLTHGISALTLPQVTLVARPQPFIRPQSQNIPPPITSTPLFPSQLDPMTYSLQQAGLLNKDKDHNGNSLVTDDPPNWPDPIDAAQAQKEHQQQQQQQQATNGGGAKPHRFTPLFSFLGLTAQPPTHPIPSLPRVPILPPDAPSPSELLFAITTTADRAKEMSALWQHFMGVDKRVQGYSEAGGHHRGDEDDIEATYSSIADSTLRSEMLHSLGNGQGGGEKPSCLIVLPMEEQDKISSVGKMLKGNGLGHCGVMSSVGLGQDLSGGKEHEERYEVRVLSVIKYGKAYAETLPHEIKWMIAGDDDTFWLDSRALRRTLSQYDYQKMHFIGHPSEAMNQLELFGKMAYGGAGMIFSQALLTKAARIWDQCLQDFKDIFGGDEMVTRCAAKTKGTSKEKVLTEEPGMHQFDLKGPGYGLFQGGLSFLSVHHLAAWMWIGLFPSGHPVNSALGQNLLLGKAAKFLGGDNMFRRWVFGDGTALVVPGYSVTLFEKPIKREEWVLMEHTWDWDWRLVYPERPLIPEYNWDSAADENTPNRKKSYFLEAVDELDENRAVFTYVTEKYDRMKIVWDGSEESGMNVWD